MTTGAALSGGGDFTRMRQALSRARSARTSAVLATLVWRQGSTYRRTGARAMIVDADVTGLLSGGCLEADIAEHAKAMLSRGESAALVSYDLASEEADSLLGIGHGCKGMLGIVLEALTADGAADDAMAVLAAHHEGDLPGAVAHLPFPAGESVHSTPMRPVTVRRLWRVGGREHVQGELREGERAVVSASLDRTLRDRKTSEEDGIITEYLPRPVSLLVVGAGVDALPVVDLAAGLGFRVTVMDHRAAALAHPRLATATRERVLVNDLAAAIGRTRARAVVVMTHNLRADQAALSGALSEGERREYVGVLGPRARTEKMLAALGLTLAARPEVCAPAGLDLGGDGADAVALAIVSEIHARLHRRDGRALTTKEGPIHDP